MLWRAVELADGTIAVVWPSEKHRGLVEDRPGSGQHRPETDEEFIAREGARAMIHPDMQGRPYVDLAPSELPERKRVDADGDELNVRPAWRRGGTTSVIVDEAAIPPQLRTLLMRIKRHISAEQRLALASEIALLREAVEDDDLDAVLAIAQRINQRQQAEQIFSAAEWKKIKTTFREKRVADL